MAPGRVRRNDPNDFNIPKTALIILQVREPCAGAAPLTGIVKGTEGPRELGIDAIVQLLFDFE